jgi:hypothetical protein
MLFLGATAILMTIISSLGDTTAIFAHGTNQYAVRLYKTDENKNKLEATTTNSTGQKYSRTIAIPYPVYHFEIADIDNNGMKDILVGVIKKTHFDPLVRKRLFAYRLDQGYIRPLWLGSKVGRPLEDFKSVRRENSTVIRTIEQDTQKNFYVGEYKWDGFGLTWIRYFGERISYENSAKLFN